MSGWRIKVRHRIALIAALSTCLLTFICFSLIGKKETPPQVSGPLSAADVEEILGILRKQRAPLAGEFSPENLNMTRNRLRERVSGRLISISSTDGEYADAVYLDSFENDRKYDYDLHRTADGWKIVGVGFSAKVKK